MNSAKAGTIKKPFIEHIRELQLRLTWSVVAIGLGGLAAYLIHPKLLELIRRPLGQTLYYTSPVGGFNFIFKLCLVTGIIVALPIILYQCFCFAGPLLKKASKRLIISFVVWSFILAAAGVLFGYLVSLPAALHFLTTFGGDNIQSLIRADEYFNFALAYVAGFALIFQVPVIMLFINRIKPLPPGRMMKMQRYIVLASFIVSAILTPTPDPVNQAIMALPMVFLYQVGIVLVWLVNNKRSRAAKKTSVRPASSATHKQGIVAKPAAPAVLIASATLPRERPLYRQPARHTPRPIMDIGPANRRGSATAPASAEYRPNYRRPRPLPVRPQLIDMVLN